MKKLLLSFLMSLCFIDGNIQAVFDPDLWLPPKKCLTQSGEKIQTEIQPQSFPKIYFTKDGQSIKKELKETNQIDLAICLSVPLWPITNGKSILSAKKSISVVLTAYGISRFAFLAHELGHAVTAYALRIPVKEIYISLLPTTGGHIDINEEYKNSLRLQYTKNNNSDAIKQFFIKSCFIHLAGPVIGALASIACMKMCDSLNENISDLVKPFAVSCLLNNIANAIPNPIWINDGQKVYMMVQAIREINRINKK